MSDEDSSRGRSATSPVEIPWTGWRDIAWRVYDEASRDRLLAVAAGVVFYWLLALFPAITSLVSAYALAVDVSTIGDHLSWAGGIMPEPAFELLRDQIARIAAQSQAGLTSAFIGGLIFALWGANAGVKAVFDALNVVYGEEEKRGFFRLNAETLLFTAGAVIAMLLAFMAVVVLPVTLAAVGLKDLNTGLIANLRWPVLLMLTIGGLMLTYRFGPSRRGAQWRWLIGGSVFAAIAWVAGSWAFSYYLANLSDFNATYGSLGAVIGLMMWLWLTAIVVLVGGEINAEIEHQTARDSTVGAPRPIGRRGAVMADTVGKPLP